MFAPYSSVDPNPIPRRTVDAIVDDDRMVTLYVELAYERLSIVGTLQRCHLNGEFSRQTIERMALSRLQCRILTEIDFWYIAIGRSKAGRNHGSLS